MELKAIFKHLKVVLVHKYYVGVECFKRGLYWQGIVHDLTKFSPIEFIPSARYFHGTKSPIGIQKEKFGYSEVWLHHKGHNPHHWEYWVDWNEGKRILCPIPDKYIQEMVCDFIGASRAYGTDDPYGYYKEHKKVF